MYRYIAGRLVQSLVSLFVVSIVVFALVRLSGDPIAIMAPAEATEKDIAAMRAHLGLDRPWADAVLVVLTRALHGDFGQSIRFRRPAIDLVLERYGATLELGGLAVLSSSSSRCPSACTPRCGAAAGSTTPPAPSPPSARRCRRSGWACCSCSSSACSCTCCPPPVAAPRSTCILPGITLGWFAVAGLMRLTRSAMLDVLGTEYVKLARIKGLPERQVIWKHAFKNAALPVVTFGALVFVALLNGSIITETVFGWPGLGLLVIEAVESRDYPIVQAVVLCLSAMYIGVNLARRHPLRVPEPQDPVRVVSDRAPGLDRRGGRAAPRPALAALAAARHREHRCSCLRARRPGPGAALARGGLARRAAHPPDRHGGLEGRAPARHRPARARRR